MMQTFLVGGAVRDELLGLPVIERDWVVVGETPESMIVQGFRPVGKDFPVFLHPETHEEYALARTERKVAPGYRGFSVQASPEVTLEQDLLRRDLTINAIARDSQGQIIDPFNGRKDLELRLLRHVSDAFCEDPVRILRVARFAARYAHLGFRVAEETTALMRSMVDAGEVDALVPERVWAEFVRALEEKTPVAFFSVLRECGAFERLFPEIERLFHGSSPAGQDVANAGQNSLRALENAARISESPVIRFAALVHGLGNPGSVEADGNNAPDSSVAGLASLNRLCDRLKVPGIYRDLAAKVLRCRGLCANLFRLPAEGILDLLQRLGAVRKDADLEPFLTTCKALSIGVNPGVMNRFPQGDFLRKCQAAVLSVDGQAVSRRGLKGAAVGEELARLRVFALNNLLRERSRYGTDIIGAKD